MIGRESGDMEELTIQERVELLLVMIVYTSEERGCGGFVDLLEIGTRMGEESVRVLTDYASHLHSRDLITFRDTKAGPLAEITEYGSRLVQEQGVTGIIPKFRANPKLFLKR